MECREVHFGEVIKMDLASNYGRFKIHQLYGTFILFIGSTYMMQSLIIQYGYVNCAVINT